MSGFTQASLTNPQFPTTWKPPVACKNCEKGTYIMTGDGTNVDDGGELRIKNLLGISIQPNRWRIYRCTECYHIQLFRLPG